jgi:hypothetical protein
MSVAQVTLGQQFVYVVVIPILQTRIDAIRGFLDAFTRASHAARGRYLSCLVRDPFPAAPLLPTASEPGAGERGSRTLGRCCLRWGLRHRLRVLGLAEGISRIGANRVLVYQYLITIVGVTSGIVVFGETLGVNKIVGGAVILLGVSLARRQERRLQV